MKKSLRRSNRVLSILLSLALVLSVCSVPVFAEDAPQTAAAYTFENVSGDGGDDVISLTADRSFKASIAVDMTEAEAAEAAKTVTWSLLRDSSKPYNDEELYPNQSEGGALDSWICTDNKTKLFTDVKTGAETVEGQVYLTVEFKNNCYFYSRGAVDYSAPHSNGGTYLDVCGYFNLTAENNGAALGSAAVKIVPYDNFHTMSEIYDEIDSIVDYAAENTNIYVERFSMGKSQGDNGMDSLDMPYMIIAKSEAAVNKWKAIKEEAETDPESLLKKIENGTLGDYQVPVMYSNVHANEVSAVDAIVEYAWMLVKAADKTGDGTISYDKLTGFTDEGVQELAKEKGAEGEKGSLAVPDLVKDKATYLGYLHPSTSGPKSVAVDLDKYYTTATEEVKIDELLDDVFFIIVPEENVEGRTYVTRTSSGGFDLNRDNSFQTQAETQNMTHLISEWNPVSFAEFHGRITAFQCEPCDPPHEPNFEYDLLAEHLMTGGEALGIAAVANNDSHNSYVIPQRDYLTYTGNGDETVWEDPWDDMSTSYTPQYAMLHGTVSYTVEVPAYDDAMVIALAYGQLGQSDYIADNKESYLKAQTEIMKRGVENLNSDEEVGPWFCDVNDVEGAEADLFRPEYDGEGENGNFYPECYIIPLDAENQSNLQAANDMMEWLTRNDVKVQLTEKEFTYKNVTYPAGTMIVTMYQAKRSVANGALYDGTVITEWPQLYSEGITAFNKTRGFDMITCADTEAYKTIAAACGEMMDYEDYQAYVKGVKASFSGVTGAKVIIVNASEDSTAAVNSLLQNGKSVSVITEGEYKGSFLCDYSTWKSIDPEYIITGIGIANSKTPASARLTKAPVVYISGKPAENTSGFYKYSLTSGSYQYNYDRQAMELLGFEVTDDASKADLIIGAAALDSQALAAIKSGTAYIGYGSNAINSVVKNGLFESGSLVYSKVGGGMDALSYVAYPEETMINASYIAEGDDILYGYGAGYFAAVPEGSKILVKLDSSKGILEGFLPSSGDNYAEFKNDSIQAISYEGEGADGADLDVVLFANTLTNKIHQRDEFNYISNAAFDAVAGEKNSGGSSGGSGGSSSGGSGSSGAADNTGADSAYTDVASDAWYADAVKKASDAGLMSGVGDKKFAPSANVSRAMIAQIVYNIAKTPDTSAANKFTDVIAGSWYEKAVTWNAEHDIVLGYGDGTFKPSVNITREQLAAILYRYAGSPETTGSLDTFVDADTASSYAKTALAWAVEKGIMNGKTGGTLDPKGTATRAQAAQMIVKYNELAASAS